MNSHLPPKRKLILDTVALSNLPLSARSVFTRASAFLKLDLVTVYRGLQALEKDGLVDGFTLPCSAHGTERFYFRNADPHMHFLHCDGCHGFSPVRSCGLDSLMKKKQKDGSMLSRHVLYFTGTCAECSKKVNRPRKPG